MNIVKIGFVGAGKVGRALGLYFRRCGLELSGYCSRTYASAQSAAGLTGSEAYPSLRALIGGSGAVFLTVPDGALEETDAKAAEIVEGTDEALRPCFFHASGALPSTCLKRLAAAGCPVGSVHPLQSFGEAEESAARLDKALFCAEGTGRAMELAEEIFRRTGAKLSPITAEQKPLYHAGACVVSNFLVTLMDSGLQFFEAAGIGRTHALEAIFPLMESTLQNVRAMGTVDALTGPVVRGDAGTVAVHLEALRRELPSQLEFYRTMADQTIEMISGKRITEKQEEELYRTIGG